MGTKTTGGSERHVLKKAAMFKCIVSIYPVCPLAQLTNSANVENGACQYMVHSEDLRDALENYQVLRELDVAPRCQPTFKCRKDLRQLVDSKATHTHTQKNTQHNKMQRILNKRISGATFRILVKRISRSKLKMRKSSGKTRPSSSRSKVTSEASRRARRDPPRPHCQGRGINWKPPTLDVESKRSGRIMSHYALHAEFSAYIRPQDLQLVPQHSFCKPKRDDHIEENIEDPKGGRHLENRSPTTS